MNYTHEQLEQWRMQVVGLAGWQVEERHRRSKGRLNPWKTRMCRHPGIMKGRWRTIGHLPNPGYSLRDCIELETQLLTSDVLRQVFTYRLIERFFYGEEDVDQEGERVNREMELDILRTRDAEKIQQWFEPSDSLSAVEVYSLLTLEAAHRLRALAETFDLLREAGVSDL